LNAKGLAILTAREEDILHLLAEGLSNRDIATTLKLSEHTIKNHLFHVFDKLGVSSRMEAVVYSFNHVEVPKRAAKRACSAEEVPLRRATGAIAINQ
jgi:DNA-binding CsgD family transcriptional regulator